MIGRIAALAVLLGCRDAPPPRPPARAGSRAPTQLDRALAARAVASFPDSEVVDIAHDRDDHVVILRSAGTWRAATFTGPADAAQLVAAGTLCDGGNHPAGIRRVAGRLALIVEDDFVRCFFVPVAGEYDVLGCFTALDDDPALPTVTDHGELLRSDGRRVPYSPSALRWSPDDAPLTWPEVLGAAAPEQTIERGPRRLAALTHGSEVALVSAESTHRGWTHLRSGTISEQLTLPSLRFATLAGHPAVVVTGVAAPSTEHTLYVLGLGTRYVRLLTLATAFSEPSAPWDSSTVQYENGDLRVTFRPADGSEIVEHLWFDDAHLAWRDDTGAVVTELGLDRDATIVRRGIP
jgi:hypothetical protein